MSAERALTSENRALLYARVSRLASPREAADMRRQQDWTSVDDQLTADRAWAQRVEAAVVGEYRDDGISASRYGRGKQRPDWTRVMEALSAGAVDILWSNEISRATRDRPVWAALLATCQEQNVLISLGAEGRLHDPNDPDDGFMLDLQAALAVRESALTSRRIRLGVRARAEAGKPHGKLAYGYKIVYDSETSKPLQRVLHEEQAPIVEELVRRCLSEEPLYSIAVDLNRRGIPPPRGSATGRVGGPTGSTGDGTVAEASSARAGRRAGLWQETQIKRIVISPTIAGIRTLHGQEMGQGGWPAIISEADHRTLVAKLTHPARKTWKDGSVKHLPVGIAVCGVCGGLCRRQKNRNTPSYVCGEKFCVARVQKYTDLLIRETVVARLACPGPYCEPLVRRSGRCGG